MDQVSHSMANLVSLLRGVDLDAVGTSPSLKTPVHPMFWCRLWSVRAPIIFSLCASNWPTNYLPYKIYCWINSTGEYIVRIHYKDSGSAVKEAMRLLKSVPRNHVSMFRFIDAYRNATLGPKVFRDWGSWNWHWAGTLTAQRSYLCTIWRKNAVHRAADWGQAWWMCFHGQMLYPEVDGWGSD